MNRIADYCVYFITVCICYVAGYMDQDMNTQFIFTVLLHYCTVHVNVPHTVHVH